ncbi:hypothetical protein [Streptomyces roseicoloratus]|uniref:hypothetical protein n=1 Tax=Streptomyces roseicoloratus TaxID=2508722 RepID=UPI001009D73C|nr:hypothetical protein [Streptomyces roseicoloratus]
MNGVELVLRAIHHGEQELADDLLAVAGRHSADHEVHHVATDLAAWSREHVERVTGTARHRGLDLAEPHQDDSSPGLLAALKENAAEAPGRRPEPGLLLLRDLRDLHLKAAENSLYWEMLAQLAQATRDDEALELASACHPRTLRQVRWTNTMIKTLCPQTLSSL